MAGRIVEYKGYTITTRMAVEGDITVAFHNDHHAGVKPGNATTDAALGWAKARIDEMEKRETA